MASWHCLHVLTCSWLSSFHVCPGGLLPSHLSWLGKVFLIPSNGSSLWVRWKNHFTILAISSLPSLIILVFLHGFRSYCFLSHLSLACSITISDVFLGNCSSPNGFAILFIELLSLMYDSASGVAPFGVCLCLGLDSSSRHRHALRAIIRC